VAELSDNVFLLEECPHDWLFPQCSAVVSLNLSFLVGFFTLILYFTIQILAAISSSKRKLRQREGE